MRTFRLRPLFISIATVSALAVTILISITTFHEQPANAISGSDWQVGNVISDSIFYDNTSMSTGDIQNFLNNKVPNCDTQGTQSAADDGYPNLTHAQYAAKMGWPGPPYICLRNYMQVPNSSQIIDNYSGNTPSGAISSAQIIKNAADTYKINPKAIITTLQKESINLIFDTWPLQSQYKNAMGYGCPDTAPCDPSYAGFYNQVNNAAWQFSQYRANSTSYRYQPYINNNIQYNPNTSCGASSVYINDYATAGLYNYTPYQPNQTALNNLYGSGDGCSSYGNRNFWRVYNDWFGSTLAAPYAWQVQSQQIFSDSARTTQVNDSTNTVSIQTGQKAYVRIRALNTGSRNWGAGTIKVSTAMQQDRTSPFADGSWLSPNRASFQTESSVQSSQIGTFDFSITAPQHAGQYIECYSLIYDGVARLNDPGLYFIVNVTDPNNPSSVQTSLKNTNGLYPGNAIVSPNGKYGVYMQSDGNLVLYKQGGGALWATGTNGQTNATTYMQSDGNIVTYNTDGRPLWASGSNGRGPASLYMQDDGNLVAYDQYGRAVWASGTNGR